MKIDVIQGNTQLLDGGAMFGNAPREMWKKWISVDEKNRMKLACNSLLIQDLDGKNILLEVGVGSFFEPKLKERYGIIENKNMTVESLKQLGLQPDDIDIIILSHLHFDHAGGLLSAFGDGETRLLFNKAKFYVSEKQWERANHPHPRDRASYIPEICKLLLESKRLTLIKESEKKLPELGSSLSFHFSDGHTPGLLLTEISTQEGPILFCSDLIVCIEWIHLALTTGYDRYPELLIDEKKRVLDYLIEKNGRLFFTHDLNNHICYVKKDATGRYMAEKSNTK